MSDLLHATLRPLRRLEPRAAQLALLAAGNPSQAIARWFEAPGPWLELQLDAVAVHPDAGCPPCLALLLRLLCEAARGDGPSPLERRLDARLWQASWVPSGRTSLGLLSIETLDDPPGLHARLALPEAMAPRLGRPRTLSSAAFGGPGPPLRLRAPRTPARVACLEALDEVPAPTAPPRGPGCPGHHLLSWCTLPEGGWILGTDFGAARLDPSGGVERVVVDGLAGRALHRVAPGPEGGAWLLSATRGLSWWPRDGAPCAFRKAQGVAHPLALVPGPEGQALVLSPDGVVELRPSWTHARPLPALDGISPSFGARSSDGVAWFGRREGGLVRLDPSGALDWWLFEDHPRFAGPNAGVQRGPQGLLLRDGPRAWRLDTRL